MEYAPIVVVIIIISLIGGFIYLKGGIRGALFGSKIETTIGEIYPEPRLMTNYILRVHKLENGAVGLELTTKNGFSFVIHGCVLSDAQVKQLSGFLEQAS